MKTKNSKQQTANSKHYKVGFLFLFSVFVTSCQNENETTTEKSVVSTNEISTATAAIIANNLVVSGVSTGKFSKNASQKKLNSLDAITTKNKETAFYVANYQNGGFAIIAADNRNAPILAFSETNSFDTDTLKFPDGLKDWFNLQKEIHSKIKKENKKQSLQAKQQWFEVIAPLAAKNKLSAKEQAMMAIDYPPEYYANQCFSSPTVEVKPLLTTEWGQGLGYNLLIPFTCPTNSGGHAPTGCVATAMAQVMKYHRMPSKYNWSNMPDFGGTTDTAILMRDIGRAVKMDYGCDGSSAYNDEIAPSFRFDFNYKSASVSEYNWQVVVNDLKASKPVILSGGRKQGGIPIDLNWYSDGHAWVCDGFLQTYSSYKNSSTNTCVEYGMLTLHMNWGWIGRYNGYFYFDNFNPYNSTYNFKVKMYTNILP